MDGSIHPIARSGWGEGLDDPRGDGKGQEKRLKNEVPVLAAAVLDVPNPVFHNDGRQEGEIKSLGESSSYMGEDLFQKPIPLN